MSMRRVMKQTAIGIILFWSKNAQKIGKVDLAGEGLKWNTNPYLGNYGIYEGKKRLLGMKLFIADGIKEVFIANHFRAILDLLFHDIVVLGRCDTLQYATRDWLNTQEQKDLLLEKATLLLEAFEDGNKRILLDWIDEERALAL